MVDNASVDQTVALALPLCDRLFSGGPERSAQRNAGLRSASGTFVLFIDSDMVLNRDVVASCVAQVATGATAVAVPEESFGQGYWAQCKQLERSFYHADRIASAARFFGRAPLLAQGGYDESLLSGEDWDISMRMAGDDIVFAETRILHDEGSLQLIAQARKKFYYGRHLRRFLRKHGKDGYRRISPIHSAFTRNLLHVLARPRYGVGVVVLKAVEAGALVAGLAADWLDASPFRLLRR